MTDVHSNGHDDTWAPDGRRYIDGKDWPANPSGGIEGGEQIAYAVIVALVVILGLLGFVNSFARVADAVRPYFGDLAPSVPLGIDVGIFAFTGLDLLMARMGMRTRWLRLVPWSLVGATVYLNVAQEDLWVGRIAHGVLPLLWVVAVEAGAHVVRVKAGLNGHGVERMDRVRLSRWLLAPGSTALLWRRMVLWEIRSLPEALSREHDRVLAKCALQERYGRVAWRWKAPRQQRALQRLGELVPKGVVREIAASNQPAAELVASTEPPPAKPKTRPRRNGTLDRKPADLAAAKKVRDRLGRVPSWKVLAAELRKDGYACGTGKAQDLKAALDGSE